MTSKTFLLFPKTAHTLLKNACPSIQFRIRTEILGQSEIDQELSDLQEQIEKDDLVCEVFNWQRPDGWLGKDFHGFDSIETGIRILAEKGLNRDHPVLSSALHALNNSDDRLHLGIGQDGKILDDLGFGGSKRIRATVFAYTKMEEQACIKQEIKKALKAFKAVREAKSISGITEEFRNKLVFKPGVIWPDIYALRLLAFTNGWRSKENLRSIRDAVQKLAELSPIPKIYVRYKSRWMAPGSFAMHDINPDMERLDDASWMRWFHRMEMFSRLGVVKGIAPLENQVVLLRNMLEIAGGMFTKPLAHHFFNAWGAYSGLRLEKDWHSPKRREYDLTFRSLLILHYSNL